MKPSDFIHPEGAGALSLSVYGHLQYSGIYNFCINDVLKYKAHQLLFKVWCKS